MSYGTGSLIFITRGDKLANRGIDSQWSTPFWLKAQICQPFQGTDYPCDRWTIPDIVRQGRSDHGIGKGHEWSSWTKPMDQELTHAQELTFYKHRNYCKHNTTLFPVLLQAILFSGFACPFSVFCFRFSFFFFLPNFRQKKEKTFILSTKIATGSTPSLALALSIHNKLKTRPHLLPSRCCFQKKQDVRHASQWSDAVGVGRGRDLWWRCGGRGRRNKSMSL